MPEFNASHAQAMIDAKASGSQANSLRGDLALGDLVIIPSSYTVAATEVANDTINLTAELPQGLVPVPALSKVAVESDPGTALIIDIGNSADPDAYADGIDLSSVGLVDYGTLKVTGLPAKQQIIATVKTATSLTADATITFYQAFRSVS